MALDLDRRAAVNRIDGRRRTPRAEVSEVPVYGVPTYAGAGSDSALAGGLSLRFEGGDRLRDRRRLGPVPGRLSLPAAVLALTVLSRARESSATTVAP